MANPEHLKILKQGVKAWNKWREENHDIEPDFSWLDLKKMDFQDTNLIKANFHEANLEQANFKKAKLERANFCRTNLYKADLSYADANSANFQGAQFAKTILTETNLEGCRIYGSSAWDLRGEPRDQSNLIISDAPLLTVDNLEIAQFIYLLLHNKKIRNVIDTIGEKGVLILGRFTEDRKAVLDAIRDILRECGFVPMMFDFEKPTQRDFTETIKTLAGLSRFIIADITNPKSSPLELQATMPDYMIPFVPIIQEDEEPFSMFRDLKQKYGEWILDVLRYDSAENLLKVLDKAVIKPALEKAAELLMKKAEGIRDRHVKDYM